MKTKAKNVLTILIILCLIISTILLARFAWAKYMAQINGQATAQIAEMKFKINGDYYKSTDEIEFASTITKQNPKVASGMLAPGTVGYIPITIDARETQTSLEYEISIDLINRPTNLKFYSDETRTDEILVKDNNITKMGYIALNSNNDDKIKYENIYWSWEEETGETRSQILNNDIEDSKFMDKIMMMKINVKGIQVKDEPFYIGNKAKIGDIIRYKAPEKTESNEFRVVNITNNKVDMMPIDNNGYAEDVGSIRIGYQDDDASNEIKIKEAIESYNNSIYTLNNEAKKRFEEKYGYTGTIRALTDEDVNKLIGYDISRAVNNSTYLTRTYYSHAKNHPFIVDKLMKVTLIDDNNVENTVLATTLKRNGDRIYVGDTISIGEKIDGKTVKSITMENTIGKNTNMSYGYTRTIMSNFFDYENNKLYWLASKSINLGNDTEIYCRFYLRGMYADSMGSVGVYNSGGGEWGYSRYVIPVISISSTIHTEQVTDENNPDKVIWEVTE